MSEIANGAAIGTVANGETVRELLRFGRERLAASQIESSALDAEVLLRHTLTLDRAQLLSRLNDEVPREARSRYLRLVNARTERAPIAYLTGYKEFMGLSFAVSPAVLVPRPETEILVEWTLAWLAGRGPAKVVDVGTGSGAIALSIAALLGPEWRGSVFASDVSAAALAVAAKNRERLGLIDLVMLEKGSLLDWLDAPVDLVLANLPYLRPNQIALNSDLAAEPRIALDGGKEGLELIAALLRDLPRVLRPGGAAGFEIDPSQRGAVVALAQAVLPDAQVTVLKDLAGLDRHVIIETGGSRGPDCAAAGGGVGLPCPARVAAPGPPA